MKFTEKTIRPKKIFNKFLELSKKDSYFFLEKKKWKKILCFSCNKKTKFIFKKNKFDFHECPNCANLFINPRPPKENFKNYYTNSNTAKYWGKVFYKKTEKSRINNLWIPKSKQIIKFLKEKKIKSFEFVDIGGGYGAFAKVMKKKYKIKTTIIEPSPYLHSVCVNSNLKSINKFLEDVKISELPEKKKIFTSFELLEHLPDPKNFFINVKSLMKKNDLFIFTTLSSLGIDILTLMKYSNSLFPPHHINFFNPVSIKLLLNKLKFSIVEVSTPGVLDFDILRNNTKYIKDNFLKKYLKFASMKEINQMQTLISNQNFSSHMMVVVKKK